jgi:hypothetical protein
MKDHSHLFCFRKGLHSLDEGPFSLILLQKRSSYLDEGPFSHFINFNQIQTQYNPSERSGKKQKTSKTNVLEVFIRVT